MDGHLNSYEFKCHFFIARTSRVDSNKMIAMSFKNFKIKVFVFTISNLLSIE